MRRGNPFKGAGKNDAALLLDEQTRAQLESLARHSYGGRFAVYMSGDDARALLASQPAADARAEVEKAVAAEDNATLRRMLCIAYAGAKFYGDDGELQDNREFPFIDFKRDSVAEIDRKMRERVSKKLAARLAANDYSGCCDTPAYCSAARRCTAKDSALAAAEAPKS